jgi:excisionase family DNA binding protein
MVDDQILVPPRLLTTAEAAEYLAVSEAFLERDRWAGGKIPYVRIGPKSIRYKLSALMAYVRQNSHVPAGK